jgi:hypothetical protein
MNNHRLFHLVNNCSVEKKNQASLSRNLRFRLTKGRNFEETRRAWACRFFFGMYLCLQDEIRYFVLIKTYFSFKSNSS